MYDILIIGAGVTGCFIARELARYKLNVLVVEKDNDVGNETTAANSAIVHSGYDPVPGTLKAKLNVLGNSMFVSVWHPSNAEAHILMTLFGTTNVLLVFPMVYCINVFPSFESKFPSTDL